jgi:hypothetical protein
MVGWDGNPPAIDSYRIMSAIKIDKGILDGEELEERDAQFLTNFCASPDLNEMRRVSFYKGTLSKVAFRGVRFEECSFAKSTFSDVSFRQCGFSKVDLTRTKFVKCFFSDCSFVECDPYYASFEGCVVAPSAFKQCYKLVKDWNKAVGLFARLMRDLEAAGDGRASRAAEYYYRVWQQRHLYHKWRSRGLSGFTPWFWSWFLGVFTGYGERPVYLLGWMFALITVMGGVYWKWFPFSLSPPVPDFLSYWYFSFKIFCAKGFTNDVLSKGLLACQVGEFILGVILLAMLVGSVTRKLSS